MSVANIEGPPTKKRRFFADSAPDPSLSASSPAGLDQDESDASIRSSNGSNQRTVGPHVQASNPKSDSPILSFDLDTFQGFVGETVPSALLTRLQTTSKNNLEVAVNMYLDGSWKSAASQPSNAPHAPFREAKLQKQTPKPLSRQTMSAMRYIGAFGVNAWATKSSISPIKHGELIHIERQKIQPPKVSRPVGARGKLSASQIPKPNSAAAKRVDVIVRFTNAKGDEIGRIPREVANWVSVLIDQKVCKFEGTCIYAPERIRTNDTIFLQLRCSLLDTAFDNFNFKRVDDNRTTGIFEEKETVQEKELRLRQVALVKLFEEINLLPKRSSKTSETMTKEARQSLINEGDAEDNAKIKSAEVDGSSPQSEEVEDGKELEQEQLDTLYKKVKTFDFDALEAEPPSTFAMELRPYQKQALHWMISKEKGDKDMASDQSMHPLWEEYAWPSKDFDGNDCTMSDSTTEEERFYVNPYSGELSLEFPVQEQHCLGGILADEMGLGKTIEMMSLIHAHRSERAIRLQTAGSNLVSVNGLPRLPANAAPIECAPCTTLVVAPMSLLSQWQSEAEKASKEGTLKSIVYYGSDKTANLQALCCETNAASAPNIIITSYGVVLSEFNQVASKNGDRGNGGIFSLNFFRVILDEAHHIKNRSSKTARACYELLAEHRWVLTGTPIVNRLEDLFSLVRFLKVEPWSNFSFWKTFITVPFESKNFMRALDVVQTVLEPLVLRRTKDMKTPNGEALVPLPPKSVDIVDIELSTAEREVYNHIFTRAKRTFAANVEAGTVMKAYTSIFAQILRLRQSCCHPILTRNQSLVADEEDANKLADAVSGLADDMDLQNLIERFAADSESTDANAFGAHVLQQIRDEADNECPVCSEEPMIEQTVTGCWHSACKKCLLDYMAHQTDQGELPRCFSCRAILNQRDVFEVVKDEGHPDATKGNPKISLQRLGSDSAKILALTNALKRLRRANPATKSVVFSQFTSFLSLIEPALTRASIPFLRLDGSMAQKARATVLADFAASTKGVVLLLSLRAGGVGLNLTVANRVFMMDPWWSFAVEAQAIDRVHRMGQVADVKVCRFIVKESVEERMLKVQEKKKFLASSLGMMSDEEKKSQRIEDIKELLS